MSRDWCSCWCVSCIEVIVRDCFVTCRKESIKCIGRHRQFFRLPVCVYFPACLHWMMEIKIVANVVTKEVAVV